MTSVLTGQTFLIVEDEPFIALDVATSFEDAGAHVVTAFSRDKALALLGAHKWAGAVLDYALDGADSASLCEWFLARKIPFIIYSGYDSLRGPCSKGFQMIKPVNSEEVVKTMGLLVAGAKSPENLQTR